MVLMTSILTKILPMLLLVVVYSSNGTKIGNTYFNSDGSVTKKVGDTYFNSDGSHTTQRGNFYYHSDGTYTQVIPSNTQIKK